MSRNGIFFRFRYWVAVIAFGVFGKLGVGVTVFSFLFFLLNYYNLLIINF